MLTLHCTDRRHATRRRILQAGSGLLGLNLPGVLRAEATVRPARARAKSVIFLFMFGGPSQLETFDMKPDAPENIRGPFKPISCKTPGLLISETLPKLAALSDRFCILRTLTHDFNDHSGGAHYVQTGRRWHVPIGGGFSPTPKDWPSIGSAVEWDAQARNSHREIPGYVVLPNTLGKLQEKGQYLRPGEHAGWLGKACNPLTTAIEKRDLQDNPYWRDCTDEELTFQVQEQSSRAQIAPQRLAERRSLLARLDDRRRLLDADPAVAGYDRFRQRALGLVSSDRTHRALNLREEPTAVRDRYGRQLFGQSCLMARRLVEAGVRFVTVHYDACDGYSWDSHVHNDDVKQRLMPTTDQAAAALIQDLHDRGMADDTLVVMLGEMGRTPKANARWGRDHWSTLFPALLAGGGVRGGSTYGKSDDQGAFPTENPVRPEDLAATLYWSLGLDPELAVPDAEGRPTRLIEDGRPVTAIFG